MVVHVRALVREIHAETENRVDISMCLTLPAGVGVSERVTVLAAI